MTPTRRPTPGTVEELELRARALKDRRVGEVAAALGFSLPSAPQRAKGFVGQVVEHALGADPKAGQRPDFPGLAVELKTIPVRSDGRPAESTFCCSITMETADQERWETSRLRQRLARVLWVPVQAAQQAPLAERRFGQARLWSPNAKETAVLRADWEDLMGAIGVGRSGTLSAREGQALQVRPKAATARVRTLAPGSDGPEWTLPLGFYLRARFTTHILAHSRSEPRAAPLTP